MMDSEKPPESCGGQTDCIVYRIGTTLQEDAKKNPIFVDSILRGSCMTANDA
jgi:hypothetical protein